MSKLSKKLRSILYAERQASIFRCPVCDSKMEVYEQKSLKCGKGHSFDFARQGYVNLVSRPVKTKYNKELFEARRKLMAEERFFEPVTNAIAEIVSRGTAEQLYILDTGCGEGTHLYDICERVEKNGRQAIGAGIDLAKEGVLLAARTYSEKIWCVADLAEAPFQDESFDVIVNILSPSNYAEFDRLLKPGGRLIKVVPKTGYLQELRTALYDDTEKETYSNEETIQRFQEKFQLNGRQSIHYQKNLDRSSLEALVMMTPLAWNAEKHKKKLVQFLEKSTGEITVELEILIGEKSQS